MEKKQKISKGTNESNDSLETRSSISEVQKKRTLKPSIDIVNSKKQLTSTKLKSSSTSLAKTSVQKSSSVKSSNSTVSSKVIGTSSTQSTSKISDVKNKNSIAKISSRILIDTSSPRSKYVKPRHDDAKVTSGAKPNFTNVTVRSPTRERSQGKLVGNHKIAVNSKDISKPTSVHNDKGNNSTNIDIDSMSRNHKRYRTRTLEPNEVKVLKPENTNMHKKDMERLSKIIKKDADIKTVAKPEAFYIPLEEKFTKPDTKSKTPIEHESDSASYDDDFESYESDFESFASSGHKDSKSDKSSILGDSEESLGDDVENTPITTQHINVYDEAHLDSGNYDLKIDVSDGKVDDARIDLEVDKIPYTFLQTRNMDSAKMPSYSDEGFDENSGGFSSTSNSANARFKESLRGTKALEEDSISVALRHARKYKQKLNYYQQRARDLSNLITFDNVEYSLFEISPIPYDVFIKTYGKNNVTQSSCQTNDDYIDDCTQTEVIMKQSKWSQHPVDYSNYDIVTKSPDQRQKRTSISNIYSDPNEIENYSSMNLITEINSIQNPMEVFKSQRLGCTIDSTSTNKSLNVNTLFTDPKQYEKLHNFIDKVGKFMINYLNETSSSDVSIGQAIKSEYKFSEEFTTPLENVSKYVRYLKDRPPVLMSVCPSNVDLLLTIHPQCKRDLQVHIEDMIFSRTLICVWDYSSTNNITEPVKVLLSVDNVSCCKFYNGLNGFVVAGTEDGITCAWDLEEQDMWHNLIQGTITKDPEMGKINKERNNKNIQSNIDNLIVRCCSFTSFSVNNMNNDSHSFHGPIVDILINRYNKNPVSNDLDVQVCVLQEYGLLTIWTVIKSKSTKLKSYTDTNNMTDHSTQAYWSNLKFYKHLVLNLQESFRHISILNNSIIERKFVKKSLSYQEFPLTDVKRKNSYKRTITPRRANDNQDDSFKNASKGYDSLESNDAEKQITLNVNDLPIIDWESKLKCLTLKCLYDSHNTQHFLVACSSGWILHYEQRGNLQNPQVYNCSGSASLIKSIEICHHNLSYFLVGCDNYVDLFSISNSKPLKSFFNEKNSENLERYYREEIICIEWSKLRPCLFFTLSNRSRLTVWDLLRSDLVPIISQVLKKGNDFVTSMSLLLDEKQIPNTEYLMLFYSTGTVEKHTLLKELTTSIHQNKDTEAAVLGRYMKLL